MTIQEQNQIKENFRKLAPSYFDDLHSLCLETAYFLKDKYFWFDDLSEAKQYSKDIFDAEEHDIEAYCLLSDTVEVENTKLVLEIYVVSSFNEEESTVYVIEID